MPAFRSRFRKNISKAKGRDRSLDLAPGGTRESALIASLPHGNFTAILRGRSNSTGVAVVEIYNVH